MRRACFLAATLVLACGQRIWADYIYDFTTTQDAGKGGNVSVSFAVSDAVVATGTISAILYNQMALTGTSPPFHDLFFSTGPTGGNGLSVDPITGMFTGLSPRVLFGDPEENVVLLSSFTPHARYAVNLPTDTEVGFGDWTVTHTSVVPEPSSLALAVAAGAVFSLGGMWRRYRCAA
jgi:hypothetical protein